MDGRQLLEYQWPYVLSLLPPREQLEESARATGAISRRRSVDTASTLLRLAFAYSFCGLSLRQTAAWAEACGIASLSDVALLKRLRNCPEWLAQLLAAKLAERAAPPLQALRLRLFDATAVSEPGSCRADWRIHVGFDLARLTIDHLELTQGSGAESLTRFQLAPNEVAIADCGYAHRAGLHHIHAAGASFLVRINRFIVPLTHLDGAPFRILDALRSLPEAEPASFSVLVAADPKRGIPAFPARLVAVRRSEAAAEKGRETARRGSSRGSHQISPETLEAAGYTFVLTNLAESHSPAEVLDLYRFRWQIELVFKRLKSILDLDLLPAKDRNLARTFLYAKLLAALLVEDFTTQALAISPWGYRIRAAEAGVAVAAAEDSGGGSTPGGARTGGLALPRPQ